MSEKKTFTYRGLQIPYQQLGKGKPLLILHGWGSSSRVMLPLANQLASIRTCYLPDLPGFGEAPEPDRPWSVDDYTDFVEKFLREMFDKKVDLLVHSFGGRITLKLCSRPAGGELIDKVLITGGAGMKPRRNARFYLRKYTANTLKAPFLILPQLLQDKALNWLRGTSLWKSLGSGEYSQLAGVMRETFVKTVTEFLEPCLPHIPHEVLLLWGKDDEATPLYQAKRMEEGLENAALVVIEHAGHYAFMDRPSHFTSIAKAFFNG